MSQDVQLVRLTASEPTGPPYRRSAFAVFAVALAIGTLIHEWNSTWTPWVAVPVVVAAVAVLLRPDSVVRLVLLMGTLVVECARQLPDPVNHQALLGILGVSLGLWWLLLLARSREAALDPAFVHERIAPFLRVAFILMWAMAALAKLNGGFMDTASTCAIWIVESMPLVAVPSLLVPVVIAGTLAMEFALPVLLLFHRTRPYAVLVALPFHAISAVAGHSWFSGFAWAFYALFLPPAVLARGAFVARTMLPRGLRTAGEAVRAQPTWLVAGAAGIAFFVAHDVVVPTLGGIAGGARHWGAVVVCLGWMAFTALVLWRLRRSWAPGAPRPRARLAVRAPLLVLGLILLVLNGATPYLGLKTTAAFTMFSNLQTEPGHWNALLIPESARVFGALDGGDVRFGDIDDPEMAAEVADERSEHTVLLGARRIAERYPEATVTYTLDGAPRTAEPVADDPMLGRPLSFLETWFGATRPYTEGGTCQH